MYTKEQMLEIYKLGAFKSIDFSERFNHVTNATTPELLVPLCLLPMSEEEREMRLNPTVRETPQHSVRGGGKGGFQESGRSKGGGKGGKGERERGGREAWSQRNSGEGRPSGWDASAGGGSRWQGEQDVRRGERLSNGSDGINGGLRDPRFTEANVSAIDTCGGGVGAAAGDGVGGLPPPVSPKGAMGAVSALPPPAPAPPPPKEWLYRDLEHTVQGPFPEAQIAEWFSMGYLPADLPMRSSDDPPDQYTPLSVLTRGGSADPPFVAAHRLRLEYEERMRVSAVAMSDKAKEREAQEMERVAMERAAQERAMQERLAAERAAQARVFSVIAPMSLSALDYHVTPSPLVTSKPFLHPSSPFPSSR